jgi:hypothetical protein
MKKTHKILNYFEAAIAVAVALALILPSATAFSNESKQTLPTNKTYNSGTMTIESKTVTAGTTDTIQITGEWDTQIQSYAVGVTFDPDEFDVVGLDMTGSVGEHADVIPPVDINNTAGTVYFGAIMIYSPPIPAGSGLLGTLEISIKADGEDGDYSVNLADHILPQQTTKYTPPGGYGYVPTFNNGIITVTGSIITYDLTLNIVGNGAVDVDPIGPYLEGTIVTLTAIPDEGWVFDSWSGDLISSDNPDTITMDSDKTVTVTFLELFDLVVDTVGSGTVNLDPEPGPYVDGTSVELTAVPDSGWKFVGWSGDLSGDTNPGTIIMDSDKAVVATFEELPKIPDLNGHGELSWVDVEPSSTVTGTITIENVGDAGSLLDWEVASAPEWGTFSFDPESGTGLTPEASPITIDVEVVAPEDQNTEFSGTITIVNSEDSSDSITIDVSLVTPVVHSTFHSMLMQFLERLCERFPMLELFFSALIA